MSVDYLANELRVDVHTDEDILHLQDLQRRLSNADYRHYRQIQREEA